MAAFGVQTTPRSRVRTRCTYGCGGASESDSESRARLSGGMGAGSGALRGLAVETDAVASPLPSQGSWTEVVVAFRRGLRL